MTPPLPAPSQAALHHLSSVDHILATLILRVGPPEIEPTPLEALDLFASLRRAIVFQQLHSKAATAIQTRLLTLLEATHPTQHHSLTLAELPDEPLRACGLSANKLRSLRDLASKMHDGTLPTPEQIASLSDDQLMEKLTAVRGIGPWTVHMFLIFTLGRPDVLPTGDFAVRKAVSLLYRKGKPLTPTQIERIAKPWKPYRSYASWYLWRSLDLW